MRTGHDHRMRFSAAALVLAGHSECRIKNVECRIKATAAVLFFILHSSFCLLHSIGCQGMVAQPRQLTVLLVEYLGPEAAASARRLGKELSDKGVPNVFIVEGADQASLCVGRFGSWKDRKSVV